MEIVLMVSPGAKEMMPLTGVNFKPGVAVPLVPVRKVTVALVELPPVRMTVMVANPLPTPSLTLNVAEAKPSRPSSLTIVSTALVCPPGAALVKPESVRLTVRSALTIRSSMIVMFVVTNVSPFGKSTGPLTAK